MQYQKFITVAIVIAATVPTIFSGNSTKLNAGLSNLSETLSKFDTSASGLLESFMKLKDSCSKNNVNLDIMSLTTAYSCLTKIYGDANNNSKTEDLLDLACKNWEKTMECLRTTLSKLEKCFSNKDLNLDGLLTEGLTEIRDSLCAKDDAFFDEIEDGASSALDCLTTKMESMLHGTAKCYDKKALHSLTLCKGFDIYKECFLESIQTCKRKGRKVIQKVLEETGLENVVLKYVLRCDTDTKSIDGDTEKKFEKIEL